MVQITLCERAVVQLAGFLHGVNDAADARLHEEIGSTGFAADDLVRIGLGGRSKKNPAK